ncbi:GTP-binding protein LepA [Candidatus Hakubella thermalkaliphila]|uniref:Elongation factor 4 n=2 Tax=Candidatus Hakubella thermalkaliphila TaxID=2754717 RepID=A0A6V8PX42_9ACTN|nr:translation elongation factor 4 [Candidatus Hakubella thermalkaliphila]GFP29928.1 GTP-binding protein LepA [Candidatus Hakubella thermalkaliphila]GFP36344.1 GTP-binding protein LepA [Candidatus Hakubella thermalkaliphila]
MAHQAQLIRNFSIIAHIDHGKSTLADRILEMTETISARDMEDQFLDSMDLERERGITIKAHAVRILYRAMDGNMYTFNLIDTPGHVDFSYEVSRSLVACEGAILVVDAVQGIQAQTVANIYLAIDNNLEIIPVLNKIDLPNARVPEVKQELSDLLGVQEEEILEISAKTGHGVGQLLERIITDIPPPRGSEEGALRALIFDSFYDSYRGVIALIRIVDGLVERGMGVEFMASGARSEVEEIGILIPRLLPVDSLSVGEVGYLISGIKNVEKVTVGDTLTGTLKRAQRPLLGYVQAKPMVFCGLFPMDGSDFEPLREALARLKLNDAALFYEPEVSGALGFGFRCGFLGLLHMEIVIQRLEREFGLELLATIPNVEYRIYDKRGEIHVVRNPTDFPDVGEIQEIQEPYVKATIFAPSEYVGNIMELCQEKRGEFEGLEYVSLTRVKFSYNLPLSEIIIDFFDLLKSRTKGYASFDYEFLGYREGDLVRVDLLLAGEMVDALATVVHKDKAYPQAREIARRLKEMLPRQLFEVAIQATIGKKVIARETIPAKRKDVLAKCYGGDITRKRKLLEKQREGKKRLKKIGRVEVPPEAFMALLSLRPKK